MKTTKTQASFAVFLDTFDPITGQPTDKDLNCLNLASLSVLVPIPFDRELGKHNLMGLLLSDGDYEQRMNLIFPPYLCPAIYDETIPKDSVLGDRAHTKVIHKAKIEDWKTFHCA